MDTAVADTEGRAEKVSHPVDRLVGQPVRTLRVKRGMSQTALGSHLGITFQQIQKYEKGTNRISASKLHDIAGLLGVEIGSFFADAGEAEKLAPADAKAPPRVDLLIAQRLSEIPEGPV